VTVGIAADGGEVVVWVDDEGVGIPEADRQRVFEPFARLDRAGLPRVSGSGIGLSVVRDLVAAHRGRVWVERGERGARVAFTLAAADPDVGDRDDTRRAQTAPDGGRAMLEGAAR
jgi:two-component system phosphate regulon sensor histidine kinase PhoR